MHGFPWRRVRWNSRTMEKKHRARQTWNYEYPANHPNVLYYLPLTQDPQNFGFYVGKHDSIETGKSIFQNYSKTGCWKEMLQFELTVMVENIFEDLTSTVEAKEVYLKIINYLW